MGRVTVFYGIGVISTFAYSKIMIYVSQGTIKNPVSYTHLPVVSVVVEFDLLPVATAAFVSAPFELPVPPDLSLIHI